MKSPLQVLHLEDDSRDAALVHETLAADGVVCEVTRVQTPADFVASLERGDCDLILADYTLPTFDGMSALKIAQDRWADLPFIFVSGTLDEEVAIEALKIGAKGLRPQDAAVEARPFGTAGVAGSRGTSGAWPRRSGATTKRGVSRRGAAAEPHRQLRLGCGQRTDLLVARDLSDLSVTSRTPPLPSTTS